MEVPPSNPLLGAEDGDASVNGAAARDGALVPGAEARGREVGATPVAATVFFLALGVLNNAPYVIMIASAKSISDGGVALVYLSGILPGAAMKATAPFWFDRASYEVRLGAGAACMVASFLLVGPLSFGSLWAQLLGVACCSLQSSLGEASLLSLASRYPGGGARAISAWSCGTGAAGLVGYAWVYVVTVACGLSLEFNAVLAVCCLPPLFVACSGRLLRTAPPGGGGAVGAARAKATVPARVAMGFGARLRFGLSLWPTTGALAVVYFAEYAMQSGAWAAMGFPSPAKAARRDTFYLYSNWLYQAGVLVSRSSGFWVKRAVPRRTLWAMALGQVGLLAFFALDAADHFWYDTSLYALCFVVGLFGGAVYVHGFRRLSTSHDASLVEIAMPIGSLASDAGIATGSVFALFLQGCLYDANRLKGATLEHMSVCSNGIHPFAR